MTCEATDILDLININFKAQEFLYLLNQPIIRIIVRILCKNKKMYFNEHGT